MCMKKIKTPRIPYAQSDNAEALAQADMEAGLRRRRRGAAANVLTGPSGIPSSPTMGGPAA